MGWARSCVRLDRGLALSPRPGPEQRLCEPRESRGTSAGQSEGPQQSPTCWLPDLGHRVARTVESHCPLCRLPGRGALSRQSEYTRTAVPVSTQKDTLLGAVIVFASIHLGVKKRHPQQVQRGKRGHSPVTFWTEMGSPQLPGDSMFYRW